MGEKHIKIAKMHGIRAQNVFWNTYSIIFKYTKSVKELEIRNITPKKRNIDLEDQIENEIWQQRAIIERNGNLQGKAKR